MIFFLIVLSCALKERGSEKAKRKRAEGDIGDAKKRAIGGKKGREKEGKKRRWR